MTEKDSTKFDATEYCQEIIESMRADPGNCDLHQRLAVAIDSPWVVLTGPTGGNLGLAMDTLIEIQRIHKPVCKLSSL